jgi:hypothetical protein
VLMGGAFRARTVMSAPGNGALLYDSCTPFSMTVRSSKTSSGVSETSMVPSAFTIVVETPDRLSMTWMGFAADPASSLKSV